QFGKGAIFSRLHPHAGFAAAEQERKNNDTRGRDIRAWRAVKPPTKTAQQQAAYRLGRGPMSFRKRRTKSPPLEFVAGNGLLDRRALLGRGIAFAGAVTTGAALTSASAEPLKDEKWSLEFGGITPPLQTPSPYEKDVVRSLSNPNGEFRNSHARTPHHLLNGTITPNSMHFSINHCGIPNIDPAKHKLVIHGMVRQ